jgi:hypothetical protein
LTVLQSTFKYILGVYLSIAILGAISIVSVLLGLAASCYLGCCARYEATQDTPKILTMPDYDYLSDEEAPRPLGSLAGSRNSFWESLFNWSTPAKPVTLNSYPSGFEFPRTDTDTSAADSDASIGGRVRVGSSLCE